MHIDDQVKNIPPKSSESVSEETSEKKLLKPIDKIIESVKEPARYLGVVIPKYNQDINYYQEYWRKFLENKYQMILIKELSDGIE